MVNNISWNSYWSALIVLVFLYYSFVLFVYYRSEILNHLSGKSRPSPIDSLELSHSVQKGNNPPNEILSGNHNSHSDEELLPVVQSLIDEMIAYLAQTGYASAVKEEILNALQQMAKKYYTIKGTSYEQAICNLMKFECENKCAVHLNDEEIRQLWMG